jgi:CDP-glycerol glycerophosphotransferase (TagB/SpsB family)
MLFFPVPTTLMLWMLRLLPPNPWSIGGGLSDAIGVFGPIDRERLIGAGVAAEKIVVTGQPLVDDLHAVSEKKSEIRQSLDDRYGFDAQKPLLCCAMPHLGEHDLIPWEVHWRDTERLLDIFAASSPEVVLSLHPKSDLKLYSDLVESRGLVIASQPLRKILPGADVFVATYSSTVRWAALLAIPTVIFDVHGMNYPMYDHIQGLVRCGSFEELSVELERVSVDEAFRRTCSDALKSSAPLLEPLDGRSVERVLKALVRRIPASTSDVAGVVRD